MKASHHYMQRLLSELSYWVWVFIIGSALGLFFYRMVPQTFEMEVVAQTALDKAEIKCFWDIGSGFSERQSRGLPLNSGPDFETYRFSLPHRTLQEIRLDPINRSGSIRLLSIRLHHRHHLFERTIDIGQLSTNDHIASIEKTDNGYTLITRDNGSDPILLISGPFEGKVPLQSSKFTWMGLCLALVIGALMKIVLQWKVCSEKPANSRFETWIQRHPRYFKLGYSSVVAVGLLFMLWQGSELIARRTYVEIDLQLAQPDGSLQLFWAQNDGFNGKRSRSYSVDKHFHRHQLRFEVPNHTQSIRLDLSERQQIVRIRNIEVKTSPFGSTRSVSGLKPTRLHQLTPEDCDQESACYRITGQDPWLVFQLP